MKYETPAGTMQGGVISPLIANIYLNELDWELDKAGLQFVRYADDSIVMCKTPEQLELAKTVVARVLKELGLELAEDKTDDIDFHNRDFDFLGFTFQHLKVSKKGNTYYVVGPSEKSIKRFKSDLKARTGKSLSKSFEHWTKELNPILRGKFNYFLIADRACMAVKEALEKRDRTFHGCAYRDYRSLDGYVRQRLRVNFSNRGKKHGGVRQGKMLTIKYGNEFFCKVMGLVSGVFMRWLIKSPEATLEWYLEYLGNSNRGKPSASKSRFFSFAYAK